MSEIAMSQEERGDLAALKQKETDGTITPAEQAELDGLRDLYQCDG